MKTFALVGKCAFCIALLASWAMCDSIQLKNGRQLRGKYIGGTATSIGFMSGGAVEYIPTSDVLALIFDNNSESPLREIEPNSYEGTPNAQPRRPSQSPQHFSTQPVPSLFTTSLPARATQFAQLAHLVPLDSDLQFSPVPPYGKSADTDAPAPLNVDLISWGFD